MILIILSGLPGHDGAATVLQSEDGVCVVKRSAHHSVLWPKSNIVVSVSQWLDFQTQVSLNYTHNGQTSIWINLLYIIRIFIESFKIRFI